MKLQKIAEYLKIGIFVVLLICFCLQAFESLKKYLGAWHTTTASIIYLFLIT